jgi:hypothetical protein
VNEITRNGFVTKNVSPLTLLQLKLQQGKISQVSSLQLHKVTRLYTFSNSCLSLSTLGYQSNTTYHTLYACCASKYEFDLLVQMHGRTKEMNQELNDAQAVEQVSGLLIEVVLGSR